MSDDHLCGICGERLTDPPTCCPAARFVYELPEPRASIYVNGPDAPRVPPVHCHYDDE